MAPADLIARWRKQVADEGKPYLWSKDEALEYLIDAQDMFVRKTRGIPDATTRALTDLPLSTGIPFTKMSPYILRVMSAQLVGAQTPVTMANHSDLGLLRTQDYGQTRQAVLLDDDTGPVTHAILGMEEHKVRWYKVPAEDDVCRLWIQRLPYPRMVDENSALEIDEQHHTHLMLWMKYRGYSKEDGETFDKNLRDYNEKQFLNYCNEARMERERAKFRPRKVAYGGM